MVLTLDAWDDLSKQIDDLHASLKKVTSVAVNSARIRDASKSAVQFYFRTARPLMSSLGMPEPDLSPIDEAFQSLNLLAQGRNRRKSYVETLRHLRELTNSAGLQRHMLAGKQAQRAKTLTRQQENIVITLKAMLPNSALSFQQATEDLLDTGRISFRGIAAELREVLREAIDHLAPDEAVISAPGFRYEKDHTGTLRASPTLKQKVRFILKTRGARSNAVSTAEGTLEQVEYGPDNLARSIYNQGSAATHTAQERKEVIKLHRYTEVLLADLLELE